MDNLLDRLTTLGVVLGFWGICYLVRLFAGYKNVKKKMRSWNWSQFLDGLFDRVCWLIATFGAVVACEMLKWLMPSIGITFSPEVTLLLDTASVIAIPFVNGVSDLVLGIKSIQASSGWANNVKSLGANTSNMNVDYSKIAHDTYDFIDTITQKSDKEQLQEDGAPEELFEDVEISEEDAGKGGITNTYPEPYRSAVQDSILDPSYMYNRECVSYCAWKIKELTGSWIKKNGSGHAKYWVQRLAENGYTTIVSKPQNGGKYVGVSESGEYGHVVWFEEGETISEYNYSIRGGFSVRVINLAAYKWVQIKAPDAQTAAEKKAAEKAESTPTKTNKKDGTVTYTYRSGDTFGQVLLDLGLSDGSHLWGSNGDVAYYTEQLHEQGIWGNIGVGTTIRLTPRE